MAEYIITGSTSSPSTWAYRLYVVGGTQDIVNNYTPITVYAQVTRVTGTSYVQNSNKAISITIDGETFSDTISYNEQGISPGDWRTLWSASKNVYHNSDGTKDLNLSSDWNNSGASPASASASGTIGLPTIPRASSVTATNAEIESATSISINRYSSSFTHTIEYSYGTDTPLTGTIVTKTTETSVGWTVPSAFYAKTPTLSGICTLTCKTYSGSTLIGTSTTTFTASVNTTTNAPTVSSTLSDSNSITTALTNKTDGSVWVKYYSNAQYNISATAKNSATIVSYSFVCGAKSLSTSSGTITGVESATFVASATDSRGITTSVTYTKTLVDYIKLTNNSVLTRTSPTSSTMHLTANGNYFNAKFGTAGDDNTLLFKWTSKETTASWPDPKVYTTVTATKDGNTYSFNADLVGTFDYKKSYDFEVLAIDGLMSVPSASTVSRGIPIFDWDGDDFNVNVRFNLVPSGVILPYAGSTAPAKFLLCDGSTFSSVDYPDLATVLGDTYGTHSGTTYYLPNLKGRVMVGRDSADASFDTLGETGGEKTHTLTTNEMPSHSHKFYRYAGGSGGYAPASVAPNTAYEQDTGSSGGGQAHNNLQPYIVLNHIIKT